MGAEAEGGTLGVRVAARLSAAGVRPGDGLVVGLSGGGDSVALLLVLVSLRGAMDLRLMAAHLHHGLRGTAADADLAFAEDLCRRVRVPLALARADVAAHARGAGLSVEMAGRVARRRFLEDVRRRAGARFIALGHHDDDQAETVLLRLARGSGSMGVGGMPPRSPDGILRPFLGERRAALRAYLAARGQEWREDETNAEPMGERNRLRLEVLPAWEAADPGVTGRLARSAARLREDGELLAAAVEALLPPAVRDNGGPWRLIPGRLWAEAAPALRRQLLRQAAHSIVGVYPPARWTEAWSEWPERHEARPDLTFLRVADTRDGPLLYRPATPVEVPVPTGAGPWRLDLPDGAAFEAIPGAPLTYADELGPAAVVRRARPGEHTRDGGPIVRVRERLRRHGVPAPCRGGAWLVDDGRLVWLPVGTEARRLLRRGGGVLELIWRAAPTHDGWPGPAWPGRQR